MVTQQAAVSKRVESQLKQVRTASVQQPASFAATLFAKCCTCAHTQNLVHMYLYKHAVLSSEACEACWLAGHQGHVLVASWPRRRDRYRSAIGQGSIQRMGA